MMTPTKLVFYLTGLFLGNMAQKTDPQSSSSVRQESRFISANVGETVTLRCFHEGDESAWLFWYKQTVGQKPRLISTFYVFDTRITFHNEFQNNSRFKLDTKKSIHHLTITGVEISDSGTYYCATSFTFVLHFAQGTIVSVRGSGSNAKASVHQSESVTIEPGGSVTLNCTVHTGSCDGEHSVYWYKKEEESHPEIIYTHGDRNDQCEKKDSTQTHTCVYNLLMRYLDQSHVGTYYCAVTACGQIVFGEGTKLDFSSDETASLDLVYYLSGALTFSTITVVLLAFSVYKTSKRNNSRCEEPRTRLSAPSTTNLEKDFKDADSLHYATVNVNQPYRSRRQRDIGKAECVYSSIKQ